VKYGLGMKKIGDPNGGGGQLDSPKDTIPSAMTQSQGRATTHPGKLGEGVVSEGSWNPLGQYRGMTKGRASNPARGGGHAGL
jgi:hypothetical protein